MSKVCEVLDSHNFNTPCCKTNDSNFCAICLKTQKVEDAINELQYYIWQVRRCEG